MIRVETAYLFSAAAVVPERVRLLLWSTLNDHAAVTVLHVRFLIWTKTVTLRDLFPIFTKLIGQPL